MATTEELKRTACDAIDRRRGQLISLAKSILQDPETGFTEHRTARLASRALEELGVPCREGLAITGVKGRFHGGGGPGPTVAVIGELDSLQVHDHPHANRVTGAAHACGHHAQISMMLGATAGLMQPEVLRKLAGSVVPFAVPAEELVEVEHRLELRQEGKLEFLGGKQELIRLGEFDDVDMALMCHTASDMGERRFSIGGTSNGHVVKYVQFKGRAAHAGTSPHLGVNALNAASVALAAIHANRETFPEQSTARVHGIMGKGGEAVNSVPSDVRLEWRVRASNPEDLVKSSERVDRCFRAGALAVGAQVTITNVPGYLPLRQNATLQALLLDNATLLMGRDRVSVMSQISTRGGSTDMGDLSYVMPVSHPYSGGATGSGHSKDYIITDYEQAVITPAKVMAMVVIDLLAQGALGAREVLANSRPAMTRDEYVAFQRQRARVEHFDGSQA